MDFNIRMFKHYVFSWVWLLGLFCGQPRIVGLGQPQVSRQLHGFALLGAFANIQTKSRTDNRYFHTLSYMWAYRFSQIQRIVAKGECSSHSWQKRRCWVLPLTLTMWTSKVGSDRQLSKLRAVALSLRRQHWGFHEKSRHWRTILQNITLYKMAPLNHVKVSIKVKRQSVATYWPFTEA